MEKEKIKFKDLSGWLKTAIVVAWALGVFYTVTFVIGFFVGLAGSLS